MKHLNFLWAALLLFACAACSDDDEPVLPPDDGNIASQFDPKFAARLLQGGYIDDISRVIRADVEGITVLDVSGTYSKYQGGKGLTSLKGIEYFTALETLNCSYNQLAELDVSGNTALKHLDCSYNQLVALDISRNTALRDLYCYVNRLTALDVSQNIALEELSCHNNRLVSLDVTQNTALEYLRCAFNPGRGGIFEVVLWPGSELTTWPESWEYEGETVTAKYTEK